MRLVCVILLLLLQSGCATVPVHSGGAFKANYDLKQLASIEILPTQVMQAPPLSELFAEGTEIYLPFLHGDDLPLSVTAAKKIQAEGMVSTPHLAARSVPSASQLDEWLDELSEAGCHRLMLIAGDPLAHRAVDRTVYRAMHRIHQVVVLRKLARRRGLHVQDVGLGRHGAGACAAEARL